MKRSQLFTGCLVSLLILCVVALAIAVSQGPGAQLTISLELNTSMFNKTASMTPSYIGGAFLGILFSVFLSYLSSNLLDMLTEKYMGINKIFRKIVPRYRRPFIFTFTIQEISALIFTGIITGVTFALVNHSLFSSEGFLTFIFIAFVINIIHLSAHLYFAHSKRVFAEYRIWILGTIMLILTTVLFHSPFGRAGTMSIENYDKRSLGLTMFIGPLSSLLLAVGFLLLMLFSIAYSNIGVIGLKISLVSCVFSLIPVSGEGKKIFDWNKRVWAMIITPAFLFYITMLILLY